jgi:hypothetical protein
LYVYSVVRKHMGEHRKALGWWLCMHLSRIHVSKIP